MISTALDHALMWRVLVDSFRKGVGVRLRLTLLALAAILPLFALLVIGLTTDRELSVEAARTHAMDLAQLIAERQNDGLQEAAELLNVLRRMPDVTSHADHCHTSLRALGADQPDFNTIGVVDSSGEIVCHNIITQAQLFSDQDFFHEVMNSDPKSFLISKFRVGSITGRPTIFVGTPFRSDLAGATNAGMVFAALNLDRFASVAHQFAGSESLSVAIIEARTGTILAQVPPINTPAGRSLSDAPLMKAILDHRAGGWAEAADFDGLKRIYGFAPLPLSHHGDLIVAVGLARSLVLADANRRMLIGLSVALGAAILAACGAWLLGDLWHLRPIQMLVEAARELGKGNFSTRVEMASWHAPEFGALASTLNEMAGDIGRFQMLLVQREAQLRLLAENATDLVFQLDLNLIRHYISPACSEILGFTAKELLGTTAFDMIHPDDRAEVAVAFQLLLRGDPERTALVYRIGHRDGHWLWVHSELRTLRDRETKEPNGILGAMRDISVLKAAEQAVRESEARYRLLADNVVDLIICLKPDLKPEYVTAASRRLLGCEPDEFTEGMLENLALPDERGFLKTALRFLQEKGYLDDFRFRVQHRDGSIRWLEMSGRKPADGESIILVLHDITTRQRAEEQLEEANNQLRDIASRDYLTGLANRRAFEAYLEKEFRRAVRSGSSLALIMIDVDRFKSYNDLYGHPAGDVCLRKMAQAIRSAMQRPTDLAARYGGEEMAILLPDTDEAGARLVAERLRTVIIDLHIEHKEGIDQIATISAGVAVVVPRRNAGTAADLVNAADQALYAVKAAGRNGVAVASALTGLRPLRPQRRHERVSHG